MWLWRASGWRVGSVVLREEEEIGWGDSGRREFKGEARGEAMTGVVLVVLVGLSVWGAKWKADLRGEFGLDEG